MVAAGPDVVPVAKGNGYGFGLRQLAAEAERLDVPVLAVGTAAEVGEVRETFHGDLVVLQPWRPADPDAVALTGDPRVISTVTRVEDVPAVAAAGERPRVVLELRTSMRRHGLDVAEARAAVEAADGAEVEGWTIHLPLLTEGRMEEARELAALAQSVRPGPLWISHLTPTEAGTLASELDVPVRLRLGTSLWLGRPGLLTTTATVLDVHRVRRGERVGYRQRRVLKDGWVLVLAGGTAHGVGLEAPTSAASPRARAVSLATGGLAAVGRALSPYTVAGRKRWFLEPPHMQSSMVLLPADAQPPAVGDTVPVQLRLTTAVVDRVVDA
ncbi:alanine racemase [Desertihabitans brevis]|uniref:Alanine racemase n=2 Tax=Desertihabitans brevis TaxID=2268447 RepID=A0A367YV54_9ACTN|nr:alanine racemase [Desertihabitans brevis]